MLRRILNTIVINGASHQRLSCVKMSTTNKEKWDLLAGVLVERLPIITKSLTPMEKEYQVLFKI